MKEIVALVLVVAFNVFLIGGTAYLVFWRGESGWWFLLSLLLCANFTYERG